MRLSFVNVVSAATVISAATAVYAEKHTIRFENKCGKGTPQLIQGGKLLSSGEDYVSNGPFSTGIAYLQTGECLFNGEHCALLEMTLVNPTSPGTGSSTDISLIAPHAFNVATSFSYFGGCDGQGATCDTASCLTAFFQPNDNQVQVQCQHNDVNLLITFCGDATNSAALKNGSNPGSSAILAPSSVASPHSSSLSHAATSTAKTVRPSRVENVEPTPSTSAAAASSPSPASSAPSCRAGSARHRRRSVDSEPPNASSNIHRRHHARNAEAAGRGGFV